MAATFRNFMKKALSLSLLRKRYTVKEKFTLEQIMRAQTDSTDIELLFFLSSTLDGSGCTWSRIWLRHCATSRKVAGSIPDGVFGIFH